MENLDRLCAEQGYEYAKKINEVFNDPKKADILLTKALNVLQEEGIYSFALFCRSRGETEKIGAQKIEEKTKQILKDKLNLIGSGDLLEEIRKEKEGLVSNLEYLTLAIQVLEKSLIYARYHVKALSKSST